MRKIIPLLIGVVLLASCVDVETRLSIHGNGSGTLVLDYSIARQLADLGRTAAEAPAVPLPLEREDFQRALAGVPGLVLKSFTRSQNELEVSIRAEISFVSLEALARVEVFQEMRLRLETSGSRRTMSVLLARAAESPVSDDSVAMVGDMFQGRALTYVVQAPSRIVSATPGAELSADGRTLTYTARMTDLVRLPEDLVLTVSW